MRRKPLSLESIAGRFGLKLIVRFGSTATGLARAGSDQDLAVLPAKRLSLMRQARLVADLGECLGGPEVDLTLLTSDDGLLLFRVANEGIPLYEATPTAFLEFRSYAARRFWDTEKFRLGTRRWLEARLA